MRKLFALMATGFLALGMAGTASAAVLNFSGTATVLLADYPVGELTGGGVATINSSAGAIPAHLSTLRLAAEPRPDRGHVHEARDRPGCHRQRRLGAGLRRRRRADRHLGRHLGRRRVDLDGRGHHAAGRHREDLPPLDGLHAVPAAGSESAHHRERRARHRQQGRRRRRADHGGRLRRHPHLAPGRSLDDQDRDGARPDHTDGRPAARHRAPGWQRAGRMVRPPPRPRRRSPAAWCSSSRRARS